MGEQPLTDAYLFGPFRLVPSQKVLLRDNEPVKLGGRALDLLQLLVSRPGHEVSRSELIDFAWPATYVDGNNLKVHISSLRRSLDDTLPQPSYIATVVGRGYQFIAPVLKECVEIQPLLGQSPHVGGQLPSLLPLVGRKRDLERVFDALDLTKFVTLVGPGGVGKTSLAISVAHIRRGDYPDGVYFVDLSATPDPDWIPHLIATALGVRGDPASLVSNIVDYLQNRRSLVVLDNCEHVLTAVAAVAARLGDAKTRSCLLVTSREPLGNVCENLQWVKPLQFPQAGSVLAARDALSFPSVQLFALRAFEAADYELVDNDAQIVADLCQALDGLPLAIEIAAAKLVHFSPADLLSSFGKRLNALKNEQDVHPRHRTLWATLNWSYELLSVKEAAMFRVMSVFAGAFEWADVAGMAKLLKYDPYNVNVALGGLVAKSLISVEVDGEAQRYRYLESARSFASAKLQQDTFAREAKRLHAYLMLKLFERAEEEWSRPESRGWRNKFESRVGDLRNALDWCFGENGDPSLGVDLTISAIRLWNEQSSVFEQLAQVGRALVHCPPTHGARTQMSTLATARAWTMTLARQLGSETEDAWNAAVKFGELSGDVPRQLSAMYGKAVFYIYTGRSRLGLELLREFASIADHADDRASQLDGERLEALAEMHLGKLVSARDKVARLANELIRGMPPSRITRYQEERYIGIHAALAFSSFLTGQVERATAIAEEMVVKTGTIGQLMAQSHVLGFVAMPLAYWRQDYGALEKFAGLLSGNLQRQSIAIWEPIHRFYVSLSLNSVDHETATESMRAALDDLVRDRFIVRVPMYFGILSDCLLHKNRIDAADEAIKTALHFQQHSEEGWCKPELLRIRAGVLAARGAREKALSVLRKAHANSVEIGARFFEARIITDFEKFADGDEKYESPLLKPLVRQSHDLPVDDGGAIAAYLDSQVSSDEIESHFGR